MVNLTRIYTRTGDGGTTRLGDGQAVRKTDPRVEACGAVDETNACLGAVLAAGIGEPAAGMLAGVQNDLFDVGADLCRPATADEAAGQAPLRITEAHVRRIEAAIDEINEALPPLRSFVLPGGVPAAAQLHVARTVCRRAERRVWALAEAVDTQGAVPANAQLLTYLNRLSDLLFVLARSQNLGQGVDDVLWRPGGEGAG